MPKSSAKNEKWGQSKYAFKAEIHSGHLFVRHPKLRGGGTSVPIDYFHFIQSHTVTDIFTKTVSQKIILNLVLLDLCLKIRCARNAPGQPPTRANRCRVFSGVR